MALETELAAYQRELPNLLSQQGRFAVFFGERFLGAYDTYHDALQVGYDAAELQPFMVKKIERFEQVHTFTRDLKLCRT